MKEQTKSRLTLFARLWAVSAVLFLVLCVVAVYGGMNDRNAVMGPAIVGFCIVFLVQIGQLVAALLVRRWWCFAGTVLGILFSLFVLVCCIVALGAGQYRPPVREEEELTDTIALIPNLNALCEVVVIGYDRRKKKAGAFAVPIEELKALDRASPNSGFSMGDIKRLRKKARHKHIQKILDNY